MVAPPGMSPSRWSACPDTAVKGVRKHPGATIEGTGGAPRPTPSGEEARSARDRGSASPTRPRARRHQPGPRQCRARRRHRRGPITVHDGRRTDTRDRLRLPGADGHDTDPRTDSRVIVGAWDLDAWNAGPDDDADRRTDSDRPRCIPVRGAVADRRTDARAGPHAATRRPGRRRPGSSARLGTGHDADADAGGGYARCSSAVHAPREAAQGSASRQEAAQATQATQAAPSASRRQAGPRPASGSREVEPRTQVPAPIAHQSQPALGSRPRADVNGSVRSSRRGLHGAIGSSSDEVRAR